MAGREVCGLTVHIFTMRFSPLQHLLSNAVLAVKYVDSWCTFSHDLQSHSTSLWTRGARFHMISSPTQQVCGLVVHVFTWSPVPLNTAVLADRSVDWWWSWWFSVPPAMELWLLEMSVMLWCTFLPCYPCSPQQCSLDLDLHMARRRTYR